MIDKNQSVVVVGAGLMGTGIAHAFASSGFPTRLVDSNGQALEKALQNIHAILDGGVKLGKLAADVAEAAKARLTIHTSLSEGDCGGSSDCSSVVVFGIAKAF